MDTGTVTGTVSIGEAGVRLAGVAVSLTGTAYSATSDDLGRFRMEEVPVGRYTAEVAHAAFGLPGAQRVNVDVRDGAVTSVRLTSPSAEEITSRWCGAGRTLGTVEAARQEVLDAVSTDRSEASDRQGGIAVVSSSQSLAAEADARGLYVLCGLPHGVPLTVRAQVGRRVGEPIRVELEEAEIRSLDLALTPGTAR
jgi:hypothetical protein